MKFHILNTDEPIADNRTITVDCGAEIPNAKAVFMWDTSNAGLPFFGTQNCCRKCSAKLTDMRRRMRTYLYGIVNAQEIRTQNEIDA